MRWRQGLAGFLIKGLIICISFFAVFGVTYKLNQSYLQRAAETVNVVTVKKDLLPGEPLTQDILQLAEKPAFGLGDDFATDAHALMESGPWYADEIGFASGDILRPGRLVPAGDKGGDWQWEFSKRDNVRLIAVETSLVRSGGDWLWPGMRVDAMVYIPAKDSYDDPQPSQIIGPEEDPLLGGLLVIDKKNAYGFTLEGQSPEEGYNRDLLPAVVTLMMGEDDTERAKALIRYNEEGKIYFSPTTKQ